VYIHCEISTVPVLFCAVCTALTPVSSSWNLKKKKLFDIYRSAATGHERVPESTDMSQGQNCKFAKLLLESYIIVAGLSQNTEFLFWLCSVSLERTRSNGAEDSPGVNCMFMSYTGFFFLSPVNTNVLLSIEMWTFEVRCKIFTILLIVTMEYMGPVAQSV
jgi:hypothetical protein